MWRSCIYRKMVNRCRVPGCRDMSSTKHEPLSRVQMETWSLAIQYNKKLPDSFKSFFVCSNHFSEKQYKRYTIVQDTFKIYTVFATMFISLQSGLYQTVHALIRPAVIYRTTRAGLWLVLYSEYCLGRVWLYKFKLNLYYEFKLFSRLDT